MAMPMQRDSAVILTAEKLAHVPAILASHDIDCWMTFVRESRDCPDPALPLIFPYTFTWRSALVITQKGERIAVIAGHDADAVRSLGQWERIETYRDDIRPVLTRVISQLDPASIALNYSDDDPMADGLSHGMYRQIAAMLPEEADRFRSAAPVIRLLRGRKSEEEIARIRRAIDVTDRIYAETAAFVRTGMKEAEIADFMRGLARQHGAETAWDPAMCPIVTSSPDSMAGHGVASQTLTVTPGCVLNIDFGIRLNDYCSDQQRAWYIPHPGETEVPADVRGAFDTVQRAIDAAAEALRPGIPGWKVDEAARRIITEAGYPDFDHATGHQLGRCAHDGGGSLAPRWPRYGTAAEQPVEVGNVFTLEPSIACIPNRGYHAVEEVVLVTESGCAFLTNRQTDLPMLRGG